MSDPVASRVFAACAVISLAACGRIGFDSQGPARDAPGDLGGADAPPTCTGPFGPPLRLDALASVGNDWGGAITDDGLELFFDSDRAGGAGGSDLYVSTRSSITAPFGAPQRIVELSSPVTDENPFIEPDALTMWFDRDGEIVRTTRPSRAAPWGPILNVTELNSPDDDVAPALTADGLEIFYASARTPTVGGIDLWRADRARTSDPFGPPIHLVGPNTTAFDCCAHLSDHDTRLLFTNDLRGLGLEVLTASRSPLGEVSAGVPFSETELGAEEVDVFESRNGRWRGVASNVAGATFLYDLYLYERACN